MKVHEDDEEERRKKKKIKIKKIKC